jgi:hypothetical protein
MEGLGKASDGMLVHASMVLRQHAAATLVFAKHAAMLVPAVLHG